MEQNNSQFQLPTRRHRSKTELFKEAYLPYLILAAAAVLIVIFIFGALSQ